MAAFYIDDGVNVNAAFTDHVAVSYDGSNWTFISKHGLEVKPTYNGNAGKLYPYNALTKIRLQNPVSCVEFECQDVSSGGGTGQHTTWQAGTQAALQTAVTDIMGWLP